MSQDPDLEDLARRYLDLWQDQVTALANDAETVEALERFLAMTGMRGSLAGDGAAGGGAAVTGGSQGAAAPWLMWPAAMMTAMQGLTRQDAQETGGTAPSKTNKAQDTGDGRATGKGESARSGSAGTQPGDGGAAHDPPASTSTAGTAAGAASSADPSGDGAGDVDKLLRRIADLEERLAALESGNPQSGSGGNRGKPARGGRKSRS